MYLLWNLYVCMLIVSEIFNFSVGKYFIKQIQKKNGKGEW